MDKRRLIGEIEDGVYKITVSPDPINNGRPWAKNVPVFDGGTYNGVYADGDGAFIVCIDDTSLSDLDTYVGKLEKNGYKKFAENSLAKNKFYTYENGENLINAYYIDCLKTVKVTAEPYYEYITETPVKKLVKPAIVASSVCDRNFYVRLPDNTLVIVDGGWRVEDWCYYDKHDLLKGMYNEMSEILGGETEIHVTMWYITHAHTDHVRVLQWLRTYPDLNEHFTIDRILFNFPPRNHLDTPDEASPKQMEEMMENIEKWHTNASKEYSHNDVFYNCPFPVYDVQGYEKLCREFFNDYDAVQIKAHDGMKFNLSGVIFEVIHTPDDDMPAVFKGMNNTSVIVKMTYEGSPMLWLGDMGELPSTSCVNMYGDLLKCDAMQVAHHGWGAATPEFYNYARPSVLFWNNSEFGFKYADRFQGYGKTKTSTDLYNMDCVKKNFFCNRIRMSYAYLPVTFEEKKELASTNLIASSVSDRTFFIKQADGKLIVIDAGFRKEDDERYSVKTLTEKLFKEMAKITGSENVVISALVSSNCFAHTNTFVMNIKGSDFEDKVKIENIIYSPAKFQKEKYNERTKELTELFNEIGENVIIAKKGNTIDIGDANFEILYSPEDVAYEFEKESSLIFRINIAGEKLLFTSDMTDNLAEKILKEYGEKLKSGVVQIANHGWGDCGSVEFYKTVGAKLQIFANSEYAFQFFRDGKGYHHNKTVADIFKLKSCLMNVFCDEVSTQYYSLPLKDSELKYDV